MAKNFKNPWESNTWGQGTEEFTRWLPEDAAYFTGVNPNARESLVKYQEKIPDGDKNSNKDKVYFKKNITKRNNNPQKRPGDCTILTTKYAENEMGGSMSYEDVVKVYIEWFENEVTPMMLYGISYQDFKFVVGDIFEYDESKKNNSTGFVFYKDAIDLGCPIISAIVNKSGTTNGHAIMIVGYNPNNNNLIYFDPEKVNLQEAVNTTFHQNINFILQTRK